MKIKLYKHQQDAVDRVAGHDRVYLAHGMGSGKTIEALFLAQKWADKAVLIICQASLVAYWARESQKWYDGADVYNLRKNKEFDAYVDAVKYGHDNVVIGIINYDLIWRSSRKKLADCLLSGTIICDEASMIQHTSSKRSKYCIGMMSRDSYHICLLSGTPCNGKYENLYYAIKILRVKGRTGEQMFKREFLDTYAITEKVRTFYGGYVDIVVGYKNINGPGGLKDVLRKNGADFLRTEDVVSLPATTDIDIPVNCTREYRRFLKDRYVIVNEEEYIGDTPLTTLLRARMLCSPATNREKAQAITDILSGTDERVIIFYNFVEECRALRAAAEKAGKENIYEVNGQKREDDKFHEHDDAVLLIQYASGSYGLNLQDCHSVIYSTPPMSVEHYDQSRARIHRIGQTAACQYYHITCMCSVEGKIYDTLAVRQDYNAKLFEKEFMH